jgi:hypothetical protein
VIAWVEAPTMALFRSAISATTRVINDLLPFSTIRRRLRQRVQKGLITGSTAGAGRHGHRGKDGTIWSAPTGRAIEVRERVSLERLPNPTTQ